jgi:hypothetical protein
MRKLITLLIVIFIICTMFSACSKNEDSDDKQQNTSSSDNADQQEATDNSDTVFDDVDVTESSDISGNFIREDGKAKFMFYAESNIWFVEGESKYRDNETGVIDMADVSGHIEGEGLEYTFDDGEGKISFTFSKDCSSVEVYTEDDEYFGKTAKFGGTYYLDISGNALMYYDVENAGYIAAAMYAADMSSEFKYSGDEVDNEFVVNFIKKYVDLYYADAAKEVDGLTEGIKYYTFDENYLNILLNTAFSENFGTDKFITDEDSGIVYNAHMYYIPVDNSITGTVEFNYDYKTPPTADSTIDYTVTIKTDKSEEVNSVLEVKIASSSSEAAFTIAEISAK